MKDKLDKLIDSYIMGMTAKEDNNGGQNETSKELVASSVRETILNEIKPTIEAQIHDTMEERIRNELEEQRRLAQVQHLKNLMLEGIILAFIVGMIVNQFTDIISVFKPEEVSFYWWIITVGSSFVFILVIISYVGLRLYNSIIEIMKNSHNTI